VSPYWRRRSQRHAWLAFAAAILTAVAYAGIPARFVLRKLSIASAYSAVAFLGATLLVGPWNVLAGRSMPVSQDLRRDLGIWAALLGVLHTIVGLNVHMGGRFWLYFVFPPGGRHAVPIRYDAFGIANYAGLLATLVLLLLLALSNDASLRALGPSRWKALQRWNYAGFALTVLHGVIYQVMEKRVLPVALAFAAGVAIVAGAQLAGYWRRKGRTANGRARSADGDGICQ
jgi:sulfoxide reductase heme-binding subunit YedZ